MAANGTAVNFGFTGSNGITCTAIKGILQSADESAEADKEEIRSGVGDVVSRNWFDQHSKFSLEVVISDTGIAAAIADTVLSGLTPGTIISITACASMPDIVATNLEVQSGANIKGTNVNAKRLTIPLEKRAGITAAQSA